MNKVTMIWMCDKIPNYEILHKLYTTIRSPEEKMLNVNEDFKIWNDGRKIYIIMDSDKIQGKRNYTFMSGDKSVNIKHLSTNDFELPVYKKGQIIKLSAVLSYSHKHYKGENKFIESCPVNMDGKFKKDLKRPFINYLEKNTGLIFSSITEDTSRLRFERIFNDEKSIYEKLELNKKVYFKNIISLQAVLEIDDPVKVSELSYKMLGKKRSYGLGNFIVEIYE